METLTAYSKLAKYASYFDVTTKMYFEDQGGIVDTDSLQQSHVTEDIYSVLCDLYSTIKRRHMDLPEFLVNDIIKSEECLASETFDTDVRYIRDFAVLSHFDKILKATISNFEELYRKSTDK